MAQFNLARFKYNWRGYWETGIEFKKDDIIYYQGKSYACLAPHVGSTFFRQDLVATEIDITYQVTIGIDTYSEQTAGRFYLNGEENPELILIRGRKYIFDQSDSSNVTYNTNPNILLFSTIENGTREGGSVYLTGVTFYLDNEEVSLENYIADFATATTRKFEIILPEVAPDIIHYFDKNYLNLGSKCNSRYNSYWSLIFRGNSWLGEWEPETIYAVGSLVTVNGVVYSCIKDHESALLWAVDDTLWQLYSPTYKWAGNWSNETLYRINDVVRYNGNVYFCIAQHTSSPAPSEANNFSPNLGIEPDLLRWEPFHLSDYWLSEWVPDYDYKINDVVKQQGNIYRCTVSHTSSGVSALFSGSWELILSGISYRGLYTVGEFYVVNSIVKYGATLFICIAEHTATAEFGFIDDNWNVYVPGLEFEEIWKNTTYYNIGDVVLYGGYSYIALENNNDKKPSTNIEWELISTNYSVKGNWESDTIYKTGSVVNDGGILYVAIADSENLQPVDDDASWRVIIPAINYRKEWLTATDYIPNDIVVLAGTLYQCIAKHISDDTVSKPDIDVANITPAYWTVVIQGSPNNKLLYEGDIKTFSSGSAVRLPIGQKGSNLVLNNQLFPSYQIFEQTDNVFYVSMEGLDSPELGTTLASPFKTIKYASEYILNNIDTDAVNTTIIVKTGIYTEILPISIPKNCAIVGDELRSTVIQPAVGYEEYNMFYMRNGSGLRNLSLQGLYGTLGEPNEYFTRRPSAGAYVSLDPGSGPSDQSVWITTRSPYVQNVSTFGTGCIGMKIDGALHDGGNDSIVANDFTQILSDGIGYWADNSGRSELVSVFTYYCHIGYLCTNGGVLRSTNGNNSYGTYGSVAEGYDESEVPITGNIDNKTEEAEFGEAITYGTTRKNIIAIGYLNAGESYTTASITFGGAGADAVGYFDEFRYNAIAQIRIEGPADSTDPGGTLYTDIINSAQSGNKTTIKLSAATTSTAANLVGQRIVIIAGLGVGQYGKISAFDETLLIATVQRESNGVVGWDHFQPGWPIEPLLNDTTRYEIEPCIEITDSDFNVTSITPPNGFDWTFLKYTNGTWMATTLGTTTLTFAYSVNNGANWTIGTSLGNYTPSRLVATATSFFLSLDHTGVADPTDILLKSDGTTWSEITLLPDNWVSITTDNIDQVWVLSSTGVVAYSSDNGSTWNTSQLPGTSTEWKLIQRGRDILVAIDGSTTLDIAKSTDNGSTWTIIPGEITISVPTAIEYGNGRFVILSGNETMYSFEGDQWYPGSLSIAQTHLSYGNGVFIASGDNLTVAKSNDGATWFTANSDNGNPFSLIQNTSWGRSGYGAGNFIILNNGGNVWSKIITGPKAVIRAKVVENAIDRFILYNPGGGYINQPVLTIIDNTNVVEVQSRIFLKSGVLGQPEMLNRGQGYTTTTAVINGDGFATNYQTGTVIKVKNLSDIPGPGTNLVIDGIDDVQYSVSRVDSFSGVGPYDATFTIYPSIGANESPGDSTSLILRKNYSQIRLTGHDFLDIGTGNKENSNYPNLYLFGETTLNNRQPENEAYFKGGGRIYYTSTDQDGNFRVGELFKVDQASGIVTISATQFDLGGLTELNLGGIQIGGTAVVVREFSKDQYFVANSNNIVPTQKAIKAYLEARIVSGGSNATTNTLVAGNVIVEGQTIGTRTEQQINFNVKNFSLKGVDGHYLAILYQD